MILIATHSNANQLGGLDEVLKVFKVDSVYVPKVEHTTDAYKNLLNAAKLTITVKMTKAGVKPPLKTGQLSLWL